MSPTAQPSLQRTISGSLMVLFGLGTIIGAGIYVLIGEVSGQAGAWAPLAFVVAAVVAGLTGLSYAELVGRIPRSAGEASYVEDAFGKAWLSRIVGFAVVFTGLVSAATLISGFSGYAREVLAIPAWGWICAVVIVVTGLAILGVTQSVGVAVSITVLELLGLLLVVIASSGQWTNETNWQVWRDGLANPNWLGIAAGGFLAFYAFIGFEDMVNMAEEVKSVARKLPRAVVITVVSATAIYLVISVVAVVSVTAVSLAESRSPMTLLARGSSWLPPAVITWISMLAILNGVVVQFLMGPRVLYGMGRAATAPKWLGRVSERTRTPIAATAVFATLVLGFALLLPIERLAQITSAVILVVFVLVNCALIVIRKRDTPAPFRVPGFVPFLGAVTCVLLLVAQFGLDFSG